MTMTQKVVVRVGTGGKMWVKVGVRIRVNFRVCQGESDDGGTKMRSAFA